jgi:hypothetical protein
MPAAFFVAFVFKWANSYNEKNMLNNATKAISRTGMAVVAFLFSRNEIVLLSLTGYKLCIFLKVYFPVRC